MKKVVKENGNYKILEESSLSRIYRSNVEHDCGALTAFRDEYTRKENLQRNKSLLSKLLSLGYGVTKVVGKYPEGGKSKKEESFFVVDKDDKGNIEKDLKKLGEEFNQDSVLIVPKGAVNDKERACLLGTNNEKDNWLGYGKKMYFKGSAFGKDNPDYTSTIKGRPFIFESVIKECEYPHTGLGVLTMRRVAEQDWRDIEIDDNYEGE